MDVMYGPFSAAYSGNSVGAVVDYVTRLPSRFEAQALLTFVSQPFSLYKTGENFKATQGSASLGSRSGDWSWLVAFNHSDSHGQPLTFATRLVSAGVTGTAGTPVTGAVLDKSNANQPWYELGSGTQYHTIQDHAKLKLAYDFSPTLRASYVLGYWQNTSEGRPASYLHDAAGQPVYSGAINVNGVAFTGAQALTGGDFALTNESLSHVMQGLSIKSHTQGVWDWEVAASSYDYRQDQKRQNAAANPLPNAASGGAGTLADGSGTGWTTLALKGVWRPQGVTGAHIADFGYQQERYVLDYRSASMAGNWLSDPAGVLLNEVGGRTQLRGIYAQDAWAFAPRWKTVLGLRLEDWTASSGVTTFGIGNAANASYASRSETFASPKAALSYQWADDLVLKASIGRAVRMPTVSELYGATSTTNAQYINDPKLKPEKSWTTEISAEKDLGNALLRLTFFSEDTRDSLYAQTTFDSSANKNISRVQNVGRIQTNGLELAFNGNDIGTPGLDVWASVTYADSIIQENDGFVVTPGDTLGKWQPNIPKWRATLLLAYKMGEHWSASLGARYSGSQYRTLNNSDVNGYTYPGVSPYFTMDARVRYAFDKQWTAAFGIDNLNNYRYWNFHPYPQRSYVAELKFDL